MIHALVFRNDHSFFAQPVLDTYNLSSIVGISCMYFSTNFCTDFFTPLSFAS